jgi:hypothetical protein
MFPLFTGASVVAGLLYERSGRAKSKRSAFYWVVGTSTSVNYLRAVAVEVEATSSAAAARKGGSLLIASVVIQGLAGWMGSQIWRLYESEGPKSELPSAVNCTT